MTERFKLCRTAAGVVFGAAAIAALGAAVRMESRSDLVFSGSVVVEPAIRPVHPLADGIVAEITHRNGDHVKSGDVVARLDDSAIRTDLLIAARTFDGLTARKARLEAERDGLSDIIFPQSLAERAKDPLVAAAIDGERKLFAGRTATWQTEVALRRLRIKLLEDQIAGFKAQDESKAAETSVIERELGGVRQLRDQSLVPIARVTALERDAIRIDGERKGVLTVVTAQAQAQIADIQLQMIAVERDRSRDFAIELHDLDDRLDEVVRRRVGLEQQLRRTDVLAPQDGIVISSQVQTAGCAVVAGEPLMMIAPTDVKPSIMARVDLKSAFGLRVGQQAKVLLVGNGEGGEVSGRLDKITRDVVDDAAARSDISRADAAEVLDYVNVSIALAQASEKPEATRLSPGRSVRVTVPSARSGRLLDMLVAFARPIQRLERVFL